MKILVTGANGFVGRTVCEQLLSEGHEVRAAVRAPGSGPRGTHEYIVGNLGEDMYRWTNALSHVDAVIHLAARVHVVKERAHDSLAEFRRANVDGTVELADRAQKSGVERFVFMSSIAVNGRPTSADPIDVASKISPSGPYGQSKWEAEEALAQLSTGGGMNVISVRAPMVYGPKAPGNTQRLIRLARTGIPFPLGNVVNRRTLISVRNLADLLVHCATCPPLGSGLVVAADADSPSTVELFREISLSVGREPKVWPVPMAFLSALANVFGRQADLSRLTDSLEVKNSSTVAGLDWQPKFTFHDAIREVGLDSKKGYEQ